MWWRMSGVRGVQAPLKRVEGVVIRGQGETTAEAVAATTCTSAESGNDHDGSCSCHRDQRRDSHGTDHGHSGRWERFIAVHSEQVCIGLGDGGRRVALTDVASSYK
jgi:hypothetical protein